MKILLIPLASLALLPTPAAAQAERVAAYVNDFIQRRNIPGVSVAVVKDGKLVLSAGYGTAHLELSVPATEKTVYEIGSISKQFTAAALLVLAEQGRLSLDDSVGKYLPDTPAAWSGITLRHLVTHTSGLPDWESRTGFSYRGTYTYDEYTGAPLIGMIIEKASGVDFERFVTEQLFRPASMQTARYKHWGDIVPHRAGGYVEEDGQLRNGEPHRPRVIAPSGGIMASAVDLANWLAALPAGTVLQPASLEQMNRDIVLNNGRRFSAGMGWFMDTFHGHRAMLHNGSTVGGFSSVIYWYPDDRLGVAVLMNIDRFNAVNVLATRIADFFVPGLSPVGMAERADPDPAQSRRFLDLLAAVAAHTDSDLLAPNLRNPGGAPRTTRSFGFSGTPDRFAFLEREELPPNTVRFGNSIRAIYRYKLVTGARTIYYLFEMTPEGKVARFLPEEG
jgi:CubicO group peptidase (beta-lactamase class C family)